MSRLLTVGLVQQSCSTDPEENLRHSRELALQAARQGAQLIVLPELHMGPYFCQTADTTKFDLAVSIPGPATDTLSAIARDANAVLIASLFEKRAPGMYHNTAVVFDRDGTMVGKYRKMHIPDDPGFYEKFYFTPGDLGFVPIVTSAGKLGVLVCWDQWFPEAARIMTLQGAIVLMYPTAIGWNPPDPDDEKTRQRDSWIIAQRAHAVANGLPVIAVNRVGFEADPSGATAGIDFWGSSFAAGPQGELLGMASVRDEEVLVVDIDLARGEEVRRIWPFLRDRRIDAYSELNQRYLED